MLKIKFKETILIVYALMKFKTEETYRLVLAKCNILFPQLIPTLIMKDYEKALKNAFSHFVSSSRYVFLLVSLYTGIVIQILFLKRS